LPSGKNYSYDKENSVMFNSGLLGINRSHLEQILDSIGIIDGMLAAGFQAHTIEQCAITEAFRLAGVEIKEAKSEIEHYWRSTDKKYMHKQLLALSVEESELPVRRIKHNWLRARLGKFL
jgi:hypothetical protein